MERKTDWDLINIIILLVCLLLIAFGCAVPQYSPVPPASKWTNGIPTAALPPEPEVQPQRTKNSALSPTGPARSYWLAWDYGDTTNIRFELWKSDRPEGPFGYWTN